jgi:WD40 repeat protein
LTRLVDVYRGVCLYGDSGTGKSSLVNAGLLPRTRELGFEPVRVRVQPRKDAEVVIDRIAVGDDGDALPCILAPEDGDSARVVLSIAEFEARLRAASRESQMLVVLDQFEELFTLFDEFDATRHALAGMIAGLLRDPIAVKLLFVFREDYLGRVKQLLTACPELVDQALRLGPPPPATLRTIVRGPFERHPGHFQRELGPDLALRLEAALAERFGTGEVSLSEVQTVCLRLWRAADPSALLQAKGVQGLLEDELGEALDAFAPDLRSAAVALLSEMVTSAGTRNVIAAHDLKQRARDDDEQLRPALLDEALDRLERESKLVRRERRRDLDLYEITSEFLVPWISRRREELRLAQLRRRELRRLRLVVMIATGIVAAVAIVAIVVIQQRADARREAKNATSLALAAASGGPLATRPDVALALAFEGYRLVARPETRSAAVAALLAARRARLRGVLPGSALPTDVAFSPDARLLATAGAHGVRIWDPTTYEQLGRLGDPRSGAVTGVAFSRDGRALATAGADGVRLWDPATRKQLRRLRAPGAAVATVVALSPATVAAGDVSGSVVLWDAASGRRTGRIDSGSGTVQAIAFSRDGRTIALAGGDGTVALWSTATLRRLDRLVGPPNAPSAVAFSPDGSTLATRTLGTIRLWDVATGQPVAVLRDDSGAVRQPVAPAEVTFVPNRKIAISPDGKVLASAGDDGVTRLWDVTTRKQFGRLNGHSTAVAAVAFGGDGAVLASAADDGVRLWDPAPPRQLAAPPGGSEAVGVAFAPRSSTLAAVNYDGVRLWDPTTSTQPRRFGGSATAAAFSPDGGTLAIATEAGVRLWSTTTGRELGRLDADGTGTVVDVAFSADGKTLAAASAEGVSLWDPSRRARLGRLASGHTERVRFTPDGTLATAGSDDGSVRLWNPASRARVATLVTSAHVVTALAISLDGRTLAAAGDDGAVHLWDLRSRAPAVRLDGRAGQISDIALTPDAMTLATAGEERVLLWDLRTKQRLGEVAANASGVSALAFRRDARTLATAGYDGTIRLTAVLFGGRSDLHAAVCGLLRTGVDEGLWHLYTAIGYRRSCP